MARFSPDRSSPTARQWCIGLSGEPPNVTRYSSEGSTGRYKAHKVFAFPSNVLISHQKETHLTVWRNGALKKKRPKLLMNSSSVIWPDHCQPSDESSVTHTIMWACLREHVWSGSVKNFSSAVFFLVLFFPHAYNPHIGVRLVRRTQAERQKASSSSTPRYQRVRKINGWEEVYSSLLLFIKFSATVAHEQEHFVWFECNHTSGSPTL